MRTGMVHPLMPGIHRNGPKAGGGGRSVPREAEPDNVRLSFDLISLTLLY